MRYIDVSYDGQKFEYDFSYRECRDLYLKYCRLSDSEFLDKLIEILHFACFVSFLKELSINQTLSDNGIIHQLVHLLHIKNEVSVRLPLIRKQFEEVLCL